MQARAFNARETLAGEYNRAAVIRDGEWLGEGAEAVRRGLEAEWGSGCVGRVVDLDGEPAIAEYEGDEGRGEPRGVVRLDVQDGNVIACRIDHDPALLERLRA